MKMTLLDMVQDILSDMDSDEVNSIDETVEALQVAQIVKSSYFALMSNRNWSHQRKTFKLLRTSNPAPTLFKTPDNLKELSMVLYDVSKDPLKRDYKEMIWKEPDDFLRGCVNRDKTKDNVEEIEVDGDFIAILNDSQPKYYTSFDDVHMVFDAYDSMLDSNLLNSKTKCTGFFMNDWEHNDSAIPDLPAEAFTALLEEAKSRAFIKLKQQQDPTATQETNRQQRWLARKSWKVNGGIKYPDYGRK